MKYAFQILTLVFLMNVGLAQKKKPNVECGFFGKKPIEERNKIFPFSDSKKVLLIAFPNAEPHEFTNSISGKYQATDSLDFVEFGYKVERVFNFKNTDASAKAETYIATKVVAIEEKAIDDLSNLVFNYRLKINRHPYSISDVNCYTPRHAIVFLNSENKVIAVLEICFECHKYYLFPNSKDMDYTLGVECDQRLNYLKDLFIKNGFEIKEH